jgi:hypothetical protein
MKVGSAVDPFIAMLNHSCDPNCSWSFEGRAFQLKSSRDIASGDELYIAYIDDLGDYYGRQKRLLEGWSFNCACSLCKEGPKGLIADSGGLGERVMMLKSEGWPDALEKFDK